MRPTKLAFVPKPFAPASSPASAHAAIPSPAPSSAPASSPSPAPSSAPASSPSPAAAPTPSTAPSSATAPSTTPSSAPTPTEVAANAHALPIPKLPINAPADPERAYHVVGSWTPTVRERFAALGPMRCGCGADIGYAWEPFYTRRSKGASMQDALAHALRDGDKKHICARIALMTAVDWPAMHELFDLHARW